MRHLLTWLWLWLFCLGGAYGLRAQTEITLLAPTPIRAPLEKSIAAFEAKTGDKVTVTWAVGSRDTEPYGTRQLVARGAAKDVSIMFAPFAEALASGNVDPKSETKLCGIVLAVTVKRCASKAGYFVGCGGEEDAAGGEVRGHCGAGAGDAGTRGWRAFEQVGPRRSTAEQDQGCTR